jgi:2-dehydro-3-deoxyphosphogluconate aldolase / (4S)-4-hydroxy-2-oxoglutarate aldolase
MNQQALSLKLQTVGIIPVIVIDRVDLAVPLGQALVDGGLLCAEVTFRTSAAEESIRRIAGEFPNILVGAGTVLKVDQAEKAINAGAKFVVAPGFNPRIVDYCQSRGTAVYPGVCTPTEIEAAMERDLTDLKFFPAEPMGGLSYLKAISAPYSQVRFVPTGGISLDNVRQYLGFNKVLACAGTWMVQKDWLAAGDFDRVRQVVAEAVTLVKEIRGAA